jgi:hypothetical protein
MFAPAVTFSTAEAITLALAVVLAILVGMIAYQRYQYSRVTPEERERQRRVALVATGKMGDATLQELHGDFLVYSYAVRGVGYTAWQDFSMLKPYLPPDRDSLIGPVLVKYDPKNPANSIILAEEWSGLRVYQSRA